LVYENQCQHVEITRNTNWFTILILIKKIWKLEKEDIYMVDNMGYEFDKYYTKFRLKDKVWFIMNKYNNNKSINIVVLRKEKGFDENVLHENEILNNKVNF
jgi:hypothetical protein